ncbi:MAG: hypothetical protein LQ352_000122 [Teloschistes flavicans]|nr:MAG: hypothetical protein LQ352_000122 [Teloschistes flavicans]
MTADDAWVTVKKSQFDCLRQHCEHCPDFRGQPQDLLDGRAVVINVQSPSGRPFKKRKTLQESGPPGASQPSHSSHQPEPQSTSQPSQEPGSQLSSLSSKTSQWSTPKRPPAERPRRRPAPKPRKFEAVEWFLRNAPKASEWRKRQIELELNTVEQYEQIIRAFTDRTNVMVKREAYRREENLEHELVDLAERFALLTKASLTNAKRQRSFATFQALILLSFCEVLRRRDVSYEVIDHTIEHIAGERDRRRLLSSARWINGVIVDLVNHGWTIYRATELFFIGLYFGLPTCKVELTSFSDALSLTNLTHIHHNESLQPILKHFKTDEFVKHDYGDCLRPEYTIPGLIASLLDACSTPANQISYGFQSDNKGNAEEKVIGLMKYAPPLVTTRIACQRQWRAYTKFRLLVKALPSLR